MSALLQNCLYPAFFANEEEEKLVCCSLFTPASDLSISEDESSVYVEAVLAGLSQKEIDITFHKGVLTIRGNKTEEEPDKKRRYYQRARNMYSYELMVPGNIDEQQEPAAELKNGIMTVVFAKQKKEEPKKIQIKTYL